MGSLLPSITVVAFGAVVGLGAARGAAAEDAGPRSEAREACGSGESWHWGADISPVWTKGFESFLTRKTPAIEGFAEALGLRRAAENLEEKTFAEYWTSLALERAGQTHLAVAGFAQVAGRKVSPLTTGIQHAALECLVRLQARYPTLEIPAAVVARLADYPRTDVVRRAAVAELRRRIALGQGKNDVTPLLTLLENGGPYEIFGRFLASVHAGDHESTLTYAKRYLAATGLPEELDRYRDAVRLLHGRAYFSLEKFTEAETELQLVGKSSNELAHSLSDLAWAQLRASKYSSAIGTAINLQSGGLRKTFTPEAPMVMAMAMNELCHYPEALRATEFFRTSYGEANVWLDKWRAAGATGKGLYASVLRYLKEKKTDAPDKIASEWTRSPHFIARQDEIRLQFLGAKAEKKAGAAAVEAQGRLARELLDLVRKLRPRYEKFLATSSPEDELPRALAQDVETLKALVGRYRRLRASEAPWRAMLAFQAKRAPVNRQRLVNEIEGELAALNLRMTLQLAEISENLHFMEVEIFQGATQDIIWQNAHPDYKQVVVTLKDDDRERERAKSWNWGQVSGGLTGAHEIWEDELGSFKADLIDNCSSKDKYLAIKQKVIGKLD